MGMTDYEREHIRLLKNIHKELKRANDLREKYQSQILEPGPLLESPGCPFVGIDLARGESYTPERILKEIEEENEERHERRRIDASWSKKSEVGCKKMAE